MFGRGGRRSASSGGKAGSGTKSAKKKARTTEDDAFDAELTAQVKELRQAMEEGVWDEEAMREVVAEMERLCEGRYERDGPGYFEEDEADGVGDGLNDFLIRMKSEILREVKLAVKKTSLFVELGKQVQQMPASVDLSALAKRASKEFPILWAAVETISRAAGKGKDELTFIRLCNLLKCGAKFCSGMAYLMSFASIFNGVNRSGFDTLSKLVGGTFSHQYVGKVLRQRQNHSIHHTLWRLFGIAQKQQTEGSTGPSYFAPRYDNTNLGGRQRNNKGCVGRSNAPAMRLDWTTWQLEHFTVPGPSELDLTLLASTPFNLSDVDGVLLASQADHHQSEIIEFSEFVFEAVVGGYGTEHWGTWAPKLIADWKDRDTHRIGTTRDELVVMRAILQNEGTAIGTRAVASEILDTLITLQAHTAAEFELWKEAMAKWQPNIKVTIKPSDLRLLTLFGVDGKGKMLLDAQIALLIEDLTVLIDSSANDAPEYDVLVKKLGLAQSLIVQSSAFHHLWQLERRVYQQHQISGQLGVVAMSQRVNMYGGGKGSILPAKGKPNIKDSDRILDALTIWAKAAVISAFKEFVGAQNLSSLRQTTLRSRCSDFARKFTSWSPQMPGEVDPNPGHSLLVSQVREAHLVINFVTLLHSGDPDKILRAFRVAMHIFTATGKATVYRKATLDVLWNALCHELEWVRVVTKNNIVIGDPPTEPDRLFEQIQAEIHGLEIEISKCSEGAVTLQGYIASLDALRDCSKILKRAQLGDGFIPTGTHVRKDDHDTVMQMMKVFDSHSFPASVWNVDIELTFASLGIAPKSVSALCGRELKGISGVYDDVSKYCAKKGVLHEPSKNN